MSYEQLAQHAAEIERTAIVKSMERRGFSQDSKGVWRSGSDVETAQAAADVTVSRFQGVSDLFTPFLNLPDPARFDPLLAHLGEVSKVLSSGNGEADPVYRAGVTANDDLLGMDTVGKALQHWRGFAAAAFRQNFVEPFPAVTTNQFALVATLQGAIDAEQAMWKAARESVDDIAHKAQVALDAVNDCSTKEQTALLTVAASVFAISAAVATAGGATAISLTVVGATAQVAGAVPREDPEKVHFDGKSAEEIVSQVQGALNKLVAQLDAKEREIANAMAESAGYLAANRTKFVSARPALADVTVATVTGPTGLGEAL